MSEPKILNIGDTVQLGEKQFVVVGMQLKTDAAGQAVNIVAQDEVLANATLTRAMDERRQAEVVGARG